MTIEQMRERLQEIVAKLDEFESLDSYNEEQTAEINSLNEEYTSLKANIEAKQKIQAMKADSAQAPRKVVDAAPATPRVVVSESKLDKTMGFKSFGEFAKAVHNKSKGHLDQRFNNSTAFEKFSEDGGVLVPSEFIDGIKTAIEGEQSLLSRATTYNVSGNHLTVKVDEQEPWNGGIQTYWVDEGEAITASKPKLKSSSFKLHKLGAMVVATDELLADAPALGSHIQKKAPEAFVHAINSAIINGSGAGKPEGILNSGFCIEVAKESGQTADTVVYKNLIKAESRILPASIGNCMWIAHPQVKEQLRQLKDDNDNAIYMNGAGFPNASAAPFDMLLGKPVMYLMGGMPALGDAGDIMLVDMRYYYAALKTQGVDQAVSTHLYFDQDKTAFRFLFRIDGKCPISSPVTTENGSYEMSGFVKIAARA
jgi:HK97 family phage major capsid protein